MQLCGKILNMKKGLIFAVIIVIIFLANLGTIKEKIKGKNVGALDVTVIKPDAFLLPHYEIFVPAKNQPKDNFDILILPYNIPNNNPTGEEKLNFVVNLKKTELPFFNETSLIINTSYLIGDVMKNKWESIEAKILSQDIIQIPIEGVSEKPIEVYRIRVELPENLEAKAWEVIQKGIFNIIKSVPEVNLVIPESFILKKGPEKFVCLVTHKDWAPSWDYQHFFIKGQLKEIITSGSRQYESYYDTSPYAFIESGITQDQEIVSKKTLQFLHLFYLLLLSSSLSSNRDLF